MAVTRRDFGKRSAAFGGLLLLPGRVLGNVALRADVPIVWDADAMVVTSDEAANRYVRSHVRTGWEMEV